MTASSTTVSQPHPATRRVLAGDSLVEAFSVNAIPLSADVVQTLQRRLSFPPTLFISRFDSERLDPSLPQVGALWVYLPATTRERDGEVSEAMQDSPLSLECDAPRALVLSVSSLGEIGVVRACARSQTQSPDAARSADCDVSDTVAFTALEVVSSPWYRAAGPDDRFERALRQDHVVMDILANAKRAWFDAVMELLSASQEPDEQQRSQVERVVAQWADAMLPNLQDALRRLDAYEGVLQQLALLSQNGTIMPYRAVRVVDLHLVSQSSRYSQCEWLRSYPPSLTEPELYAAGDAVLAKLVGGKVSVTEVVTT